MKLTSLIFLLGVGLFAQTASGPATASPAPSTSAPAVDQSVLTPLASITLPASVYAGISYNQLVGVQGVMSGIMPESSKVGIYGSVTADLIPVKYVGADGKAHYLIGSSFRAGQHKTLFDDGKNTFLIGGDFGFSATGNGTSSSLSLGLSGSFTATYIRRLSAHWGIALPVRMLWMSNVGPGGTGAWNPVIEPGIIWSH